MTRSRGVCTANWVRRRLDGVRRLLRGQSDERRVALLRGQRAITRDGHESDVERRRASTRRASTRAMRSSTPRRLASDSSGFLFFEDATQKLGVVGAASRTDLDFTVERHSDGSLWFAPARSDVDHGALLDEAGRRSDVDRSRAVDRVWQRHHRSRSGLWLCLSGHEGGRRALRRGSRGVLATDYVVFDWSYQNAPGNAELNRGSDSRRRYRSERSSESASERRPAASPLNCRRGLVEFPPCTTK